MNIAIKISLIIFALFCIDRLGLWAEKRGYVYWRHKKPKDSGGGAASALLTMQAAFNPSARHTIEAEETKDAKERDGQGDEPEELNLNF